MTVTKGTFVEIEFTGKITDTKEIFDTTKQEEAKEANLQVKDLRPFILSIGNKMLPPGFDADIEGKEIGTEYTVNLEAEQAFGKRDPKLVQMIPTKMFHAQNINPQRGMQLSLEGRIVRILSSDRGRTLVDMNGPLAGKKITYTYKILREITEEKEKINALQDFLFRKQFEFKTENNKIIFKTKKEEETIIQLFKPKFKEIIGKDIEAETTEETGKEVKETKTQ